MIEVILRKDEVAPKKKECRDGAKDSIRVVLLGEDKSNLVEVRLTIKYDEGNDLPHEYKEILGENWYDEIVMTLGKGTQQSKL